MAITRISLRTPNSILSDLNPHYYHAVLYLDRVCCKGCGRRTGDVPAGKIIFPAMAGTDELFGFLPVVNQAAKMTADGGQHRELPGRGDNEHAGLPLLAGNGVDKLSLFYPGAGHLILRDERKPGQLPVLSAGGCEDLQPREQETETKQGEHAV